jgi:hypothetical protein
MSTIVKRLGRSLQRDGSFKTLKKVLLRPFRIVIKRISAKNWEKVLELETAEDKFHAIYERNLWGDGESASGGGSTLRFTENLRRRLPALLAQYSVRIVFDAPCGDFNWMRHLLSEVDVGYIGGDIVRPLIESHNSKYKSDRISFIHIDLTKDDFPGADLMICRDCLFHLSFEDIRSVLKNFVASGIPYLLTSTHKNNAGFSNRDIRTGDFRLIDLYSAPFHFPTQPLAAIEDWVAPHAERQMCLWRLYAFPCGT